MAIGDEQIDRLIAGMHAAVVELDDVLTKKIAEVRELLNGITVTSSVTANEVKPPAPQ